MAAASACASGDGVRGARDLGVRHQRLASFGIDVHRGLAGTGIVGTLSVGEVPRSVCAPTWTRCRWKSATTSRIARRGPARCTPAAMTGTRGRCRRRLLPGRDATVSGHSVLIFQPAEENEAGGRVMVERGLFQNFPVSAVYGMHNWPACRSAASACGRAR